MTDNKETVEVEEKNEAAPEAQPTAHENKVEATAEETPLQNTELNKETASEPKSESAPNEEAKPADDVTAAPEATSATEETPVSEKEAEAPKEEPNPLERSVEFKVPKASVEAERRKIIQQYAKTARLDGFRKGKVPYSVLNELYGVQAHNEALEKILNEELPKALLPFAANRVNAPDVQLVPNENPEATDLTFKATFEVAPDVKLPDFKTLKVTKYECTLTDEDVENTIKVMQQQRTVFTDVDRPCKDGDKVTISFEGRLNGEVFQGGKHDNYSFILGNGQMLPDFEKEIPGMKPGDEKTFKMTFPSNYNSSELAGKEVEFTVKVKEVGDPKVPPLDDEFAKAFQIEGGMDELRANVRQNLEREVKARINEKTKQGVFSTLLTLATYPVPKSVVEERRKTMLNAQVESFKNRGITIDPNTMPANAMYQQALNLVKLSYIVNKIVVDNGIFATEDQIKALATEISKSYEDPKEVIKWYLSDKDRKNELASIVTETNAVDWIVNNADTQTQIVDFKDLMAEPRLQ